jgi:ribonuclease HI
MAEYRAILLVMKYALQKGYTKIQVKGDSKLVCMQVGLLLITCLLLMPLIWLAC